MNFQYTFINLYIATTQLDDGKVDIWTENI